MRGRTGDELLRLPVRTGGISLGRSVELVLDLEGRRALGVDVDCGDAVRRFLPLAVADVRDDALVVDSALHLLDDTERRFYRERGVTLSSARGLVVEREGERLGRLRDVVLGRTGEIVSVLAGREPGPVPFDESVRLAPPLAGDGRRRAPAA